MKLLLVSTPINLQESLGSFSTIYDSMKTSPLGLAYLASFVRQKEGIEVKILDQYSECLHINKVYDFINSFCPDLIGYSITTPNWYAAIDMIRRIKKKFSHILNVVGGCHPSIFPEETLSHESIDFVIRGEGEVPLLGLVKALKNTAKRFDRVPGLSFKVNSKQIHNKLHEPVDVNLLPFPAYDLLPMHLYSSPNYNKLASPVHQMIASRGCPYECAYCINTGKKVSFTYRKRNIKSVIDEMEMLVGKYNAKQIQFKDPVFPLGRKHAIEFCEHIIRQKLLKKIVWSCTTRAEFMEEAIIKLMARAGCKGVGFGIESGVPELLESVKKRTDFKKVRKACEAARKSGMVVMSGFILGFPNETKEMTQKTIDFAKSLDLHYIQFNMMVPYPGTPLYDELKKQGEIKALTEKDYSRYNQSIGLTDLEPVWVPKGRGTFELKKMQRQAYIDFYFRPRFLFMLLPHLKFCILSEVFKSFLAVFRLGVQSIMEKVKAWFTKNTKQKL